MSQQVAVLYMLLCALVVAPGAWVAFKMLRDRNKK
jgi:hypothetical protein